MESARDLANGCGTYIRAGQLMTTPPRPLRPSPPLLAPPSLRPGPPRQEKVKFLLTIFDESKCSVCTGEEVARMSAMVLSILGRCIGAPAVRVKEVSRAMKQDVGCASGRRGVAPAGGWSSSCQRLGSGRAVPIPRSRPLPTPLFGSSPHAPNLLLCQDQQDQPACHIAPPCAFVRLE